MAIVFQECDSFSFLQRMNMSEFKKIKLENGVCKRRKMARDINRDWEKVLRVDLRKEIKTVIEGIRDNALPICKFAIEPDMSLEHQWREKRRNVCALSISSWEHDDESIMDDDDIEDAVEPNKEIPDDDSWGSWGELSPREVFKKEKDVDISPPTSPPPPPSRVSASNNDNICDWLKLRNIPSPSGTTDTSSKAQPLKFQRSKRAVLNLDGDSEQPEPEPLPKE